MGSLMAGWDSPNLDPKTVRVERNRSFTKEEIENFWESHNKPTDQQLHMNDGEALKQQISFDMPHFVFQEIKCPIDLEKTRKTSDWWTRSNSAFLNEPPSEEILKSAGSNYSAQFHVAEHPATKTTSAN
ncbi:hypothetical protein ACHQM5_008275 [Ranunculus cassubicifolius]